MWNWQTALDVTSYGTSWRKYVPCDISVSDVMDTNTLRRYIENRYCQTGIVNEYIGWVLDNVHADQIESDLEGLLGRPFLPGPINVYVTTFHRAPYDAKSHCLFSIQRVSERARSITSIYHELMHFVFHWYYWEPCRSAGLTDIETHSFKESLTTLLNPLLIGRGLPLDSGYLQHQVLREKWDILWKESNMEFDVFFQKALAEYLKIIRSNR